MKNEKQEEEKKPSVIGSLITLALVGALIYYSIKLLMI